ncbi:MAG: G/U mismatch-specific DNA glycosylase [Streptosporangiales bacterium]|nr:G/U mismatch-specific DNA glycosylase [Streptosporangiales bacterium]
MHAGSDSWRPTEKDLAAAEGRTVPDVIAPGLRVLFCGINPGLYSAAVGHHFARPGNRFWKALHEAGFTERLLSPFEDTALPARGLGITNLVDRATAGAADLSAAELQRGVGRLEDKVRDYGPAAVAVLGMHAYRTAFGRRHARIGPQPETICGAHLWLLPNPSGAQARYQLADLVDILRELRETVWSAARSEDRSAIRWLVDGMNVIGTRPDGWWRDRDAAVRRLVHRLERHQDSSGEPLTVVFDGRPPADLADASVQVRFAPRRGRDAADDEIVRMVETDRDPGSLRVVTSDSTLAARARAGGAGVVSAGSFLRRLGDR